MIEAEAETFAQTVLHVPHFGAIVGNRFASLGSGQFSRGAVFVGGAEEQDLVTATAQVTGIEICGQLRTYQIAQMLDPVDIRNGRCDQMPCHEMPALVSRVWPRLPQLVRQG